MDKNGLDIARRRLRNQYLRGPKLANAGDVVRALGAVQAQDYGNAKWALGMRTSDARDADVEREISSGRIIRTHVLRPTWHFVTPEDARWMLALTGPRVTRAMASYNRKLELDARVFAKSNALLTRALRDGQSLTRAELRVVLERGGIEISTGQRMAHLLMQAELDAVICSGARRAKQFTYALFDERVPPARALDRDEALGELGRRYFTTRGPATVHDFAWWSGLAVADARRAVEVASSSLSRRTIADREYWLGRETPPRTAHRAPRVAQLLPNYDEFFVGFKDRSAIGERLRQSVRKPRVDALMGHLVFIDGQIVGGWKRAPRKAGGISLDLLVPVSTPERRLVSAEEKRFQTFFGSA